MTSHGIGFTRPDSSLELRQNGWTRDAFCTIDQKAGWGTVASAREERENLVKTSVTLRYEGPALDAGRMDVYEASANMIAC